MEYLNAHCHLELSFLQGKIPSGLPFVEWLERVIVARRTLNLPENRRIAQDAIALALSQMQQDGTRLVVDIDSLGITPGVLTPEGLQVMSFKELICFKPEQSLPLISAEVLAFGANGLQRTGLSPHSPYTVCEPLLYQTGDQLPGVPLCIHAAETQEEVDFLLQGTGPLRDFFDQLGALPPGWKAPKLRPIEYLDQCNLLTKKTLLVHCNHLAEHELQLIAKRGCSVVVCPGTHVYFERGEFPLKRLKDAGIPVFLGTDSLASNEVLSMAREIEMACELSPSVSKDWIRGLADAKRALWFSCKQ